MTDASSLYEDRMPKQFSTMADVTSMVLRCLASASHAASENHNVDSLLAC